jgi:hypothetical protein
MVLEDGKSKVRWLHLVGFWWESLSTSTHGRKRKWACVKGHMLRAEVRENPESYTCLYDTHSPNN